MSFRHFNVCLRLSGEMEILYINLWLFSSLCFY